MAGAKVVRLWKREDGEQPKALALDGRPPMGPDGKPLPGRLYNVTAPSADAARDVLALFLAPEPDRKTDKARWLDWDTARDLVREVIS